MYGHNYADCRAYAAIQPFFTIVQPQCKVTESGNIQIKYRKIFLFLFQKKSIFRYFFCLFPFDSVPNALGRPMAKKNFMSERVPGDLSLRGLSEGSPRALRGGPVNVLSMRDEWHSFWAQPSGIELRHSFWAKHHGTADWQSRLAQLVGTAFKHSVRFKAK